MIRTLAFACTLVLSGLTAAALEPLGEDWDWVKPAKQVAAKFKGTPGVVLHIGDSITYANPYGSWARNGQGQTAEDKALLKWMHTNDKDDKDGWFLAAVDRPGGRSDTAASGMRLDEALTSGKSGLPTIAAMLKKYNPQIVVLMLGTNDASAGRAMEKYKADLETAIKTVVENNTILVLSTLPPHVGKNELAKQYNEAVKELAKKNGLPVIDYYGAIMKLAPEDWNGTIMTRGDVHPAAGNPAGEPTDENFKKSGYLLRGWLSVQKLKQVKAKVIDSAGETGGSTSAPATTQPAARTPATKPAEAKDDKRALIKEGYDYAKPMIAAAKKFKGSPGVVVHIGDSNTYANPYGQWARTGSGQSEDDKAVLKWSHLNDEDNRDKDGWYLCRVDREGNRSDTAGGPVSYASLLKGEGMTSAKDIVSKYNPQIAVIMLGTWDAAARRSGSDVQTDIEQAVKLFLDNGTVVILSTVPPYPNEDESNKAVNDAIKEAAKKNGLPLIDFWGQAKKLEPVQAESKIRQEGGALLTLPDDSAAQEPTVENLSKNGYLLKGWLSVQKIKEVKKNVIDAAGK